MSLSASEIAATPAEHDSSRSPNLKRKHDAETEQDEDTKRARLDEEKTSNIPDSTIETSVAAEESNTSTAPEVRPIDEDEQDMQVKERDIQHSKAGSRRKSGQVDEKQRSKRLFGSLLGTLGQTGDRTVNKKRQEIEARRKAELRKQDDAFVENRHRKRENLHESRKADQLQVDEEHMRIRHRSMKDRANFLMTRSHPRLYYLPWELRKSEEDKLREQQIQVQNDVDDEIDDFKRRRVAGRGKNGRESNTDRHQAESDVDRRQQRTEVAMTEDQDSIDDVRERSATTPMDTGTEQSDVQKDNKLKEPDPVDKTVDEADDDHIVEGEEDNVIY